MLRGDLSRVRNVLPLISSAFNDGLARIHLVARFGLEASGGGGAGLGAKVEAKGTGSAEYVADMDLMGVIASPTLEEITQILRGSPGPTVATASDAE